VSRKLLPEVTKRAALSGPVASIEKIEQIDSNGSENCGVDWHSERMANPSSKLQNLKLSELTRDPSVNCRAGGTNPTLVTEYAEALDSGTSFPPVVVFRDKEGEHWLADGFHRAAAHEVAGRATIECDVREGDRRAALLHAAGANAIHGARRTAHDKRRAVEVLLADPEWAAKSDRWIADTASVSITFVGTVRTARVHVDTSRPRKGKDGKSYRPKGPAPKRKRRSVFEKLVLSIAGDAAVLAKRSAKALEAGKAELGGLPKEARESAYQRLSMAHKALHELSTVVLAAKDSAL
jgi:hypothetical protein